MATGPSDQAIDFPGNRSVRTAIGLRARAEAAPTWHKHGFRRSGTGSVIRWSPAVGSKTRAAPPCLCLDCTARGA